MNKFTAALRRFFFPAPSAPVWLRILPYAVLGLLTILVLTAGAYGWDYTNSPPFCGETCHTMPPEYSAYLTSPHARIACVECHIGRDFIATQITRKAGDLRHVIFTITKKYEFPITADDMRPAREACEKCHFPEKFSDDSLKELDSYGNDALNTPIRTFLILKTGGGAKRVGLGRGIHWHIENRILYYPTDKSEQNIPYIRVYNDDGTQDEYVDIQSGINPATIDESSLKEMDCITCHNRITHLVNQPEVSVDIALSRKTIDPAIPEIRRQAVEALRVKYTSQEQAMKGIAALVEFYQTYYPDYYAANQENINTAISTVKDIYSSSVYIEQKSDWDSHPNNVGHKYSPGCFRCHDGKHLNAQKEAVRLECNLCHSIPVVSGVQDFLTRIEISRGPEPETHLHPNWILQHREAFNETCSTCHTTSDPGGTSNSSFCSNSACHGSTWTYAGFNAPALREIIQKQMPPTPTPAPLPSGRADLTYEATIGPLFTTRCGACHGDTAMKGLKLTTYSAALAGSSSGPVIVPGDPDASLLVKIQSSEQPHFGQLTPEELQVVKDWIASGAPEK